MRSKKGAKFVPCKCTGMVTVVTHTVMLPSCCCLSQDVSRDCVLKIVGEWLGKSPLHTVHLKCAMFGYEHIIMAVSQRFKTRVHIAAWRLAAYQHLPAVAQCLTLDGSSTRIHCCNYTVRVGLFPQFRTCKSSLEGATKLKFVPFCSP